ncbi:hypothetical protein DNTS_035485 [Danionella cerebrum]|uniref:OTU domain-containing protein n=1 Tax=Danionella cerebrum TaxID=2873325 RepID=A0A553R696_9TELE|nr:hypothetical protein DNTS_035485 [Danionella translucida]
MKKSGNKSGLQTKRNKKTQGSSLRSTAVHQTQKAKVKGQVSRKDVNSGCERSSTMQKQSQTKDTSPQSDADSSLQCLQKTLSAEDEISEVDLYRGEEEIVEELLQPVSEAQSSVSAAEDLQTYSQREWKGNTTKSQLIRKGYEAIASEFSLCRVRGDNYCALRATLFQLLSQSTKLPVCFQDADSKWPKELDSEEVFLKDWQFPFESKKSKFQRLNQCLELLKKKWCEAVQCESLAEREHLCQQLFRGLEEEYELLEALKFLMLRAAIELHAEMLKSSAVPEFCWLLYARDSSKNPMSLLTNHLRHVGFSGGLEQVEMCLLGHSLHQTIKVFRLYKFDTEEFITYYPSDRKDDWPPLCLLTEDDRHYNALVPKTKKSPKFDEHGRPKWKTPAVGSSLTTRL